MATAAPARWPYREHRTLAEVDHQERQAENAAWAWGDDFEERTNRHRMKAGSEQLLKALRNATLVTAPPQAVASFPGADPLSAGDSVFDAPHAGVISRTKENDHA